MPCRRAQPSSTASGTTPYIVVNDLPKIDSLKRLFPVIYRATPVLVGGGTGFR
jgi:hypothetical protein